MYEKFIDKFMPSKDMREYLKKVNLKVSDIARIIYGSPRPVDEKLIALKECCESFSDGTDEYALNCIKGMISCIEKALQIKDEEGIYSMEQCIYDEFRYHTDRYFESLYCNYDEAISFANSIGDEMAPGNLTWFEITKWTKDKTGKLYKQCTYYFVKKELRYINISFSIDGFSEEMIGGRELYLPVPFKAGDIVRIDGCGFTPSFTAVIIDVGDNSDCCSLQAVARDSSFRWSSGAVRLGMIGSYQGEYPSMLYTIERYDGILREEDEILIDISNYIKQGTEKVSEFVGKIKYGGSFSDNELKILMCKTQ